LNEQLIIPKVLFREYTEHSNNQCVAKLDEKIKQKSNKKIKSLSKTVKTLSKNFSLKSTIYVSNESNSTLPNFIPN